MLTSCDRGVDYTASDILDSSGLLVSFFAFNAIAWADCLCEITRAECMLRAARSVINVPLRLNGMGVISSEFQ